MSDDYYSVLGVGKNASKNDIRTAFRKKAKMYHPDVNKDSSQAEHKFKEINTAYEVLKDPKKKNIYDQVGHDVFANKMSGANGRRAHPGFNADFTGSMSDIFDNIFGEFMDTGRGRYQNRRTRGEDLSYNVEITLEDAYHGKNINLNLPVNKKCQDCSGSGSKPGSAHSMCQYCQGTGKFRTSQGLFTIERTCGKCSGKGTVITDPCYQCGGRGVVKKNQQLSIDIPPGVGDGTSVRLTGKGNVGANGGSNGDLYVNINLKSHSIFERDGAHLFTRMPVSVVKATLGGDFQINSLDGKKIEFKIPTGTQTGRQFRIKNKGMPYLKNRKYFGDLHVQIDIETPVNLNEKQKQLLREFEKYAEHDTYPETQSFMQKMKQFVSKLKIAIF